MRILWLNWRDIKNPMAGGAELVTHETAKRLVKAGHAVTILTAKFPDAKNTEIIDGVKILRAGNSFTCRIFAFFKYRKQFKGRVDIIIDEINTIPFFTNFYAKEEKIALIHQLAREFWWSETFFPLSLIGYILEPLCLKTYRNIPTIACSNSTKKDLAKLGFKNISLYHHGLSVKPLSKLPPKNTPDILYLGRLTKPKGPQDAIAAFHIVHKKMPDSKLIVVGSGKPKFVKFLKSQVKKLDMENSVKILGFIPEKEKIDLLKKSKIVLVPSVREGWNMVPIEANAFGCIPIGYNVPGLKDSIINHKTGILTKPNPHSLARAAINILSNRKKNNFISRNGLLWAKQFNWRKTYLSIKSVIEKNYY